MELELLSHNPSAPLAGIMDLTGHNTSLCGDCACHPRPRDPMSHSIYTRAPLLHRLMRRSYASEQTWPRLGLVDTRQNWWLWAEGRDCWASARRARAVRQASLGPSEHPSSLALAAVAVI